MKYCIETDDMIVVPTQKDYNPKYFYFNIYDSDEDKLSSRTNCIPSSIRKPVRGTSPYNYLDNIIQLEGRYYVCPLRMYELDFLPYIESIEKVTGNIVVDLSIPKHTVEPMLIKDKYVFGVSIFSLTVLLASLIQVSRHVYYINYDDEYFRIRLGRGWQKALIMIYMKYSEDKSLNRLRTQANTLQYALIKTGMFPNRRC